MRGVICYYSSTGNTRLACEAIAARAKAVEFELFDVCSGEAPDLTGADLVGFAAWAEFGDPPQRMKAFMESLPLRDGTPAFVFCTYGSVPFRTLATLDRWARNCGFRVVAGEGLHTPENFPPLIKRGWKFADAPSEKELAGFDRFVRRLDVAARKLSAGESLPARRADLARFLPAFSRKHARRAMGEKTVDTEACIECGTCRDVCPYGAITLDPKPVFAQSKCYGCWACYNHCPTQAIYTRKIRGVAPYRAPSDALRGKLLR